MSRDMSKKQFDAALVAVGVAVGVGMKTPCRASAELRAKMLEDDADYQREVRFRRIYDELFADHETDCEAWFDYLTPADQKSLCLLLLEAPLDNVRDIRRKYCERALEAWATEVERADEERVRMGCSGE